MHGVNIVHGTIVQNAMDSVLYGGDINKGCGEMCMRKKAIIMTVDTEGDDLWNWKPGKSIETNNSMYIEPFQNLCEKYNIPPVYLINYEMIMSDSFVEFVKEKAQQGKCEIGMHLHAWNSPPVVKLKSEYGGNPYITEFSREDIFEKHKYLKQLIIDRIGINPIAYRAGRWATNDDLFDVLEELGFLVDCSVTPGINHKAPGATVKSSNSYRNERYTPQKLRETLWEMPMTTEIRRSIKGKGIYRKVVNLLRGEEKWLRPALQTAEEMLDLIDDMIDKGVPYLMFMIHSSELMPGGSPYCSTEEEVSEYLGKLENVFKKISMVGSGYSIKEYYNMELRGK